MNSNWGEREYFSWLLNNDKQSHSALEKLVDDLHVDKDRTVTSFLCHSGSEDFLWGLVRLLANPNSRVAGNAAYIIGTLAESELGCFRVLSLTRSRNEEGKKILGYLSQMLTFDDAESVMNAAGTLGTLAESHEGREWILSEECLDQTIEHVTVLLQNSNMWTASNAALVLARLSISEEGCSRILSHASSHDILTKLVMALGVDEAGRGMNAAFAIGRLCDTASGRNRLLSLPESEKMITALARMLCSKDSGVSKNACFALSCLATTPEGHSRLLGNNLADHVLKQLADLLTAEDSETGWFAAMTLRTIASQPKGCLKLRGVQYIKSALKAVTFQKSVNSDLKEEVVVTLEILKLLEKPSPPEVEVKGAHEVEVKWAEITTKSGLEVFYQVVEGNTAVYDGKDTQCTLKELVPLTQYSIKLRVYTEGDDSPFSDVVTVTTEETVPGPPSNPRVLGSTATQLKVSWEPPELPNGTIKGYYVYQGGNVLEHTTELMCIVTGLQPATAYEIEICAATTKGKGSRVTVVGHTAEIGAHAPPRPDVTVMGRNEMHVNWRAPEVPLGRITRYDLSMNNKTIYSGMDHSFSVRRLVPDTEYAFVVTALTNEGRFESKVTKKRTSKDEYDVTRAPLYQTPVKKEEEPVKPSTNDHRKKRSISNGGETKPHRTNSATARRGSRISPEQGHKDPSSSDWKVDQSYPEVVMVNKGSKSLVGLGRRESTNLQPRVRRRNSENLSKGTQLRERGGLKPLEKRENTHSWTKSVFPLNMGSLASEQETEKVPDPLAQDSILSGNFNTDPFGNIAGFGITKSKTTLNRRDLERTRPINRKERLSPGEQSAQHLAIETPTWAPQMDLLSNKAPRMHNKFVPMQFRTQPANLSLGHIQRTNTQVLDAKGFGGMNLRRVDNLSRSMSQVDMRSSNAQQLHREHTISSTSQNSQHNRRLQSQTSVDTHKSDIHSIDVT